MGKQRYANYPSQKERDNFAKYLSEDEELVIAAGYGSTYLRQRFILSLLIPGSLFILIGLGVAYYYKYNLGYGLLGGFALSLVAAYLHTLWVFHSHRYLLTTRRVIFKLGLFKVRLISALFDKITHIEVDQGLLDRFLMHHGRIIIHTAGMSKDELVLQYVEAPVEFKNVLERLINRQRERSMPTSSTGVIIPIEGELVK